MIRKTNNESNESGQEFRLQASGPGVGGYKYAFSVPCLDTHAPDLPTLAFNLFGPAAFGSILGAISAGKLDCFICERLLALKRYSDEDARIIGVMKGAQNIGSLFAVCEACVKRYGDVEEAGRMAVERLLSDRNWEGSALTEGQYKAQLKRERRQAKRRR